MIWAQRILSLQELTGRMVRETENVHLLIEKYESSADVQNILLRGVISLVIDHDRLEKGAGLQILLDVQEPSKTPYRDVSSGISRVLNAIKAVSI